MEATSDSAVEEYPEPADNPMPDKRIAGNLVDALIERHATLWLLLLLALLSVAAIWQSQQKRFWYDEIFTIIVASQPTWHRFAQAMPADGNPPINALLTRASIYFFGITNFGVRLPPLVGFLSALIGVYIFVRREAGAVFALLALAIMMAQPAWRYSYEARPYGLILGFLMLGMVSWQSASRSEDATPRRRRTLALAGVAAGVVGSILTHHLGTVNIGIPLLCGEASRVYTRRRFDWPLNVTALVAALGSLAISVPMIHRTHALLFSHLPALTVHTLPSFLSLGYTTFLTTVNVGLTAFLAGVLLLLWILKVLPQGKFKFRSGRTVHGSYKVAPHILAASVGMTLLIPITFLIMAKEGGWYSCRYGIGSIAGIAILSSLLLYRHLGQGSLLAVAFLLVLSGSYLRTFIQNVRHKFEDIGDTLVYDNGTELPVVISDPLLYPVVWWYAPEEMKDRVVYLYSTPKSLASNLVLAESALIAEKPLIAMQFQPYGSFVASHDHFLLDIGPADAELEDSFRSAGYRVTFLRSQEKETLFEVEREHH